MFRALLWSYFSLNGNVCYYGMEKDIYENSSEDYKLHTPALYFPNMTPLTPFVFFLSKMEALTRGYLINTGFNKKKNAANFPFSIHCYVLIYFNYVYIRFLICNESCGSKIKCPLIVNCNYLCPSLAVELFFDF